MGGRHVWSLESSLFWLLFLDVLISRPSRPVALPMPKPWRTAPQKGNLRRICKQSTVNGSSQASVSHSSVWKITLQNPQDGIEHFVWSSQLVFFYFFCVPAYQIIKSGLTCVLFMRWMQKWLDLIEAPLATEQKRSYAPARAKGAILQHKIKCPDLTASTKFGTQLDVHMTQARTKEITRTWDVLKQDTKGRAVLERNTGKQTTEASQHSDTKPRSGPSQAASAPTTCWDWNYTEFRVFRDFLVVLSNLRMQQRICSSPRHCHPGDCSYFTMFSLIKYKHYIALPLFRPSLFCIILWCGQWGQCLIAKRASGDAAGGPTMATKATWIRIRVEARFNWI